MRELELQNTQHALVECRARERPVGERLFDGRDRSHICVIAERGDCRDNVVAAVVGEVLGIAVQPRLIAGDEFLSKTGLVVLVKECGDEVLSGQQHKADDGSSGAGKGRFKRYGGLF